MKIKLGLLLLFLWVTCNSLTAQQKKQVMASEEFAYNAQKLKSIDFFDSGNNTFLLRKDDETVLVPPQWDPSIPNNPRPVGYVSGTTPQIYAVFENCTKPLWIKGNGILGAGTPNPIALTFPATELIPSGGEVNYGPVSPLLNGANFAFPALTVAYYERFDIEWKACITNSPTEADWITIETSSNPIYVTYKKPEREIPFLTVIHLGCTNANGISGPEATAGPAIVDAMFTPFAKENFDVRRTSDNVKLTYYAASNTSEASTCIDMKGMLVNNTPGSPGDGRCGAFGELFYRMIKDQGLSGVVGNVIFPQGLGGPPDYITSMSLASQAAAHAAAEAHWENNNTIEIEEKNYFFLVKEWSGVTVNNFIPLTGLTLNRAQSSMGDLGVPGQGNVADPRSIFRNHLYIQYGGKSYDPSYGITIDNTSLASYEDLNINAVSGTIVKRIENNAPKYYYWVEKVNDSTPQFQTSDPF